MARYVTGNQGKLTAGRSDPEAVTPTTEEVAKLIKAAQSDDPVMAVAVALAFVTGARRGELAALRWSDIDLDTGTVRIERSLTQVGKITEKGTKTNRGRTVAIDARTLALLERHRVWQVSLSSGPNRRSWRTPTCLATTRTQLGQCSRQRSPTDLHRCETRSRCGQSDSTIYAMPTSPSSWRPG